MNSDAPQRPLSRKYVPQATHIHADVFVRSIDTQVTRLRRKLEDGSSGPSIIRAERRVGYVFTLPVKSS
jgi:two-component system OmpR family response regulator